jgi:putative zinc finger/helix-turn-helix YgiT family protein
MKSDRKCATCKEGVLTEAVVDYQTEMEHDGRSYDIRIPDLEVLRCDRCGSIVLPDASYGRLADALRERAGLLFPAEIARGREQIGLNQKDLAQLVGVAPANVARWESGDQLQQRIMNDFLDAVFHVPELRTYLRRRKGVPGEPNGQAEPHPATASPTGAEDGLR